ncbi:MAG: flavin monoamine oxidase family protein, partial [Ilumatobacter sp.]
RRLNDLGFWNFLLMNMSNEAFSYLHDVVGHFFEVANWNCAEALPWFLGDGAAAYRTLVGGYDQLPKQLADEFGRAGGLVQLNTPVTGVTKPPLEPFSLDVHPGVGATPYTAGRVVLAMPQRALDLLAPHCVAIGHESMKSVMSSVTGRKVMKIFLTFDRPWWNDVGITSGASSTDLPLGQCWYFDPPASGGDGLMMASYNDTLATTYWQGLEGGTRFTNTAPNVPKNWAEQTASQGMVDEVLRQLAEMHPGATIPAPTSAAYMDWTKDPFGGAFSTWNVGVDVQAVEDRMIHPDPSLPLHVCGSTYSSDQGWAEGALQTAERVAQEHFGLLKPNWLN